MKYPDKTRFKQDSGQMKGAVEGNNAGAVETAQDGSGKRKRYKAPLRMTVTFSDRATFDYRPAARAFAQLWAPELTAALRETKEILRSLADEEPVPEVDPVELRKQELQEQMAAIQAELSILEEES